MRPPGGGGACMSKLEEVVMRSCPGMGNPTGFFAKSRDLFCTIVKYNWGVEGEVVFATEVEYV